MYLNEIVDTDAHLRVDGIDYLFNLQADEREIRWLAPGQHGLDRGDRALLMSYKESVSGQMLHEGISEAGSMASAIAESSPLKRSKPQLAGARFP